MFFHLNAMLHFLSLPSLSVIKVLSREAQKVIYFRRCRIKVSHVFALEKIYTSMEVLFDRPLPESLQQTPSHIQEPVTKAVWEPVFIVRVTLHLPEPYILELYDIKVIVLSYTNIRSIRLQFFSILQFYRDYVWYLRIGKDCILPNHIPKHKHQPMPFTCFSVTICEILALQLCCSWQNEKGVPVIPVCQTS